MIRHNLKPPDAISLVILDPIMVIKVHHNFSSKYGRNLNKNYYKLWVNNVFY